MNQPAKKNHAPAIRDEAEPPVVTMLKQFSKQITQSLPKHLTGDRMIRIVMNEFRRCPALLKCDPASVIGSIVQSAQLGLEIGSGLGHAYLVPFGKECQFIPGYKGLADLTRRTGKIKGLWSEKVLRGDYFEYGFKAGRPVLDWKPNDEIDRSLDNDLTHAFAVAEFDNGSTEWVVMSVAEIERIKAKRKNKYDGVWDEHYGEMAKKTALRRLMKTLPMSPELIDVLEADNAVHDGRAQDNHRALIQAGVIDANYKINHMDEQDVPPSDAERRSVAVDQAKVTGDALTQFKSAVVRVRAKGANPYAMIRMTEEAALKLESSKLLAATDILNDWCDKEQQSLTPS